jgi:hypothetical protein
MKVKVFVELPGNIEPKINEWFEKHGEFIEVNYTSQSTINSVIVITLWYTTTGYKK